MGFYLGEGVDRFGDLPFEEMNKFWNGYYDNLTCKELRDVWDKMIGSGLYWATAIKDTTGGNN